VDRKNENLKKSAVDVVQRLQQAGFTAYWAGGCVRDRLLGIDPKDYDIATNALPDRVLELFPGSTAVGKNFGVVVVRFRNINFEIATFRQDHDYRDGRRPERVSFVTAEEDAERRDFTINAMFYDPIADELHDFVGGRADLDAKKIRCVGEASRRFAEDHLRMMRAVRFASRLGFKIDTDTASAIRKHAAAVERISKDRIQVELTRTLMEAEKPGDAVLLLEELGLLQVILPQVAAMRHQEQPPQFHPEGDVLTHTVIMLNMMAFRDVILVYSVLFHDLGKPPTAMLDGTRIRFNCHADVGAEMARKIMRELRFSNAVIDGVAHCVRGHMRFMDVKKMRRSTLRRLLGDPLFDIGQELHRVDCLSSHGLLDNYEFLQKAGEDMKNEPVLPPKWVNGRDIIALGISAGPQIGKWLKYAYDAQLNGEYPDRDALLNHLAEKIESGSEV